MTDPTRDVQIYNFDDDDGNVKTIVIPLTGEPCRYCGGNCPNEPDDSEFLCDGFAGDIDNLYGRYLAD